MITVLIPAHNEDAVIAEAIKSVKRQSRKVDSIVVVADNCTDNTVDVAMEHSASVFQTANNTDKKAGALNQVLRTLLPYQRDHDKILVMDADSFLDDTFVETAEEWLERDGGKTYGGIGGTFRGRLDQPAKGLIQRWVTAAQSNEYARYARDVNRKNGKVLVLTGTATLFSVSALKDVIVGRLNGTLPGGKGEVYDTSVLTEDNELTLALRHFGWDVRSPEGCTLTTEVMMTVRDLYRQRLRWKRGAMENLAQYGFSRYTMLHWGYQVVGFVGIMITMLYLTTLALGAVTGTLEFHLLWMIVTAIFVVERVVTVATRGWRAMLLASTLVVEMAYDIFLQLIHLKAFADAALGRTAKW